MTKPDTKTCFTCHEEKPVSEFYHRGDKPGYRPNCKECYKGARLRNNSDKEKKRIAAFKEKESIATNPSGFLIAGILEMAVKDHRSDDDLTEFFDSSLFVEYCTLIDADADYVRKHI